MSLLSICLLLAISISVPLEGKENAVDKGHPLLGPEFTCTKKGKIRWFHNDKSVSKETGYCFNSKSHQIESFSCHKDKTCKAYDYKKVDMEKFYGKVGSPGFKVCSQAYFSVPKVLEFHDGKKWVKASICEFSDGHFIDIGRLVSRSR